MKKILLFFVAFGMCMTSFATQINWDATAQSYENQQAITSVTVDANISVAFDKGTNSNAPKYFTSGTAIRCYGGNTITVSSTNATITGVKFSFGSSDGSNAISASTGSYTGGSWSSTGASSVVFTIGGTSGNRRISGIEITYTISGSSEPAPTLTSIAVSGAPTKTVYQEGEVFAPAGLTVTGTYDDNTTAAITSGITWTVTPATGLTAGTTSVSVVATVGEISSAAYTVNGLTVNGVTLITCAEANALGANAAAMLGEVTVVYVNGMYNYVKDASGYTLVYGANSGWTAGDVVASVSGVASPYHGLPELKVNSFDGIEVAHGGAAPQPELQTAAPTAADVHRFVKFEGVSVAAGSFTTSSATNLNMTLADGTTVTLRNAFKLAQTFAAGKTYDVVGLVAIYDTNIQVYFVSAEEQEVEGAVAAPEITPAATSFYGSMEVTITAEEGLLLAYTLDGSTPVENENATFSTGNTATFTIDATTTVKAAAYNSNGVFSEEVSATYTKIAAATLPFEFDGGNAAIGGTAGMTATGLGSDYGSSPKLKFDGNGDNLVINYEGAAKTVTFTVKGNGSNTTPWAGVFEVLESADGDTYTTVAQYTELASTATAITLDLNAASRFVKFVYVTKTTGNVALGAIRIAAASELELPELAFEQATYSFFVDAEDKAVVATSSNSEGAITYALTEGDASAFLIDEATGDIVCETAGTYTVTATIAATATHEAGTATCEVVIANRPAADSYYAVVSSYEDNGVTHYYAMGSDNENKALNAVEVYMANGVAVTTGSKEEISWMLDAAGHVVNMAGEYVRYSKGDITLAESTTAVYTEETTEDEENQYWISSSRSFIYRASIDGFKNYATSNAGTSGYGTIGYLTDMAEGFVVPGLAEGTMGTICLDRSIEVADLYGANFYSVSSATATSVICDLETEGLIAGYPYIYVIDDMDEATTSGVANLIAVYGGAAEVTTAEHNNGLYGVLEATTLTDGDLYVLASKTGNFIKCGAGWTVEANQAYLDLNALISASAAPKKAPNANAASSITIPVGSGVATGIDEVGSMKAQKIVRDGKIVILKNGAEYSVLGQKM